MDLIKQREELERATKARIEELLKESVDLEADTAKRQEYIKTELKALGYKRPRERKAAE